MNKFKSGDKVKVVSSVLKTYWYSDKIGEVFTLYNYIPGFGWNVVGDSCSYLKECDVELVKEKEEMQFDMKKNPWFIRVNNKEEFEAAKEWVKSQGIKFKFSEDWYDQIIAVESDGFALCIRTEAGEKILNKNEIKLTFKTVIDSVEYPTIESEQDKKIKELQETIETAKRQIEELKSIK